MAVYSDADKDALHVRYADDAVHIGPAPAAKSYLNGAELIRAARESGADAIHPGYGFLSENAGFARACREAGITFVGPTPEAIERMGDKALARKTAIEAGVPVVPGTEGTVSGVDEALVAADAIGYPIMVKAAAGGGGRGIRIAHSPEELKTAVEVAQREAQVAFGDGSVYLERRLENARHVEVQVLGDSRSFIHLYERECSMQRRRQKVVEETPSPALATAAREQMADAAVRLARAVNYSGAGTMEFLLDSDGHFYFIEMNTRIQVEHPITEVVTGVDLVQEQIRVAAGQPLRLSQEEIKPMGCAMEFRINAEDPEKGFFPSPGTIATLEVPGGPGVRVDSALYQGYRIAPFYDSMVAKLIVYGPTRFEVISRARRALREFRIEGIKTTVGLHERLLRDENFLKGTYHTNYLEQLLAES